MCIGNTCDYGLRRPIKHFGAWLQLGFSTCIGLRMTGSSPLKPAGLPVFVYDPTPLFSLTYLFTTLLNLLFLPYLVGAMIHMQVF